MHSFQKLQGSSTAFVDKVTVQRDVFYFHFIYEHAPPRVSPFLVSELVSNSRRYSRLVDSAHAYGGDTMLPLSLRWRFIVTLRTVTAGNHCFSPIIILEILKDFHSL
jgi:hypothetical protein